MIDSDLRAALIAAFPLAPITRETIHAADARWAGYDGLDYLPLVEGKSWLELAPERLEWHAGFLVRAGGALYRAILPAYLLVLIQHETVHEDDRSLWWAVVSQLTRKDSNVDREIFDERVGPMTAEQRDVVRRAIAILARQAKLVDDEAWEEINSMGDPPMGLLMGQFAYGVAISAALRSW